MDLNLKRWHNSTIRFAVRYKLSLIVPILLYKYETWTLLVNMSKRIQSFENKFLRMLLWRFYVERKTSDLSMEQGCNSRETSGTPSCNSQTVQSGLVWLYDLAKQLETIHGVLWRRVDAKVHRGRVSLQMKEWTGSSMQDLLIIA